jgi:hypothetical protein
MQGVAMLSGDEAGLQAVVFVADRAGAALRRRERCLKLAGIPHGVVAERRPSGTYHKLCVRDGDAVAAHLALQMGGCGRSLRLREPVAGSPLDALREFGRTLWDEAAYLALWLLDLVRETAPRLLTGPRQQVSDRSA